MIRIKIEGESSGDGDLVLVRLAILRTEIIFQRTKNIFFRNFAAMLPRIFQKPFVERHSRAWQQRGSMAANGENSLGLLGLDDPFCDFGFVVIKQEFQRKPNPFLLSAENFSAPSGEYLCAVHNKVAGE